jgi:hypothetical protein
MVTDAQDESTSQVWEIEEKYATQLECLYQSEALASLMQLLSEKGKPVITKCDYNIVLNV